MTASLETLRSSARSFAEDLVRERLQKPTTVDAWRELLLRLSVKGWLSPPGVAGYPEAGAILEGLSLGGADLGVPLTLTVHYLVTLKVLRNEGAEYLSRISEGVGLACMAASEPKVGAHPGKISTTATKGPNGWTLNGLKVFTTGGPVGTVFLVLAVCGESAEGRDLGTFLVPREAAGFTVKEMPLHPGLESAPHGVLEFKNVEVPASALIGPSGRKENGWTRIVRAFRQWEDALLQSWVAGLAQRHAGELQAQLPEARAALPVGRLLALSRGLATLARDSALSLADEEAGAQEPELTERRYAFYEALSQVRLAVSDLEGLQVFPKDHGALAGLRAIQMQLEFAKNARAKILQDLAQTK